MSFPRPQFFLLFLPLASLSVASDSFEQSIRPFIAKNCYGCHNQKLSSGGLNLEAFQSGAALEHSRDAWEEILQKMQSREMPPKGTPRPDEHELQQVTQSISAELNRMDRAAKPEPGHIVAHRLNRAEYNNTVRDLLAIDLDEAAEFPQDDSGYGFDNVASVLSISPLLMEKYLTAAEQISKVAVFGPQVKPSTARFQPPNRRRLEKNSEKELLVAPLKTDPPYTIQDYDTTGLGQPSSIHVNYRFPGAGDYVFKMAVGHNRPPGWDPVPLAIWIDGKMAGSVDVAPDERDVVLTGDRQALHEVRLRVPEGSHWIAATFLRQYEGLPASFGGPNPTKRPPPPVLNVDKGRKLPPETADGIKVDWMEITGPFNPPGPSAQSRKLIFTCGHTDGNHNASCPRRIVTDLTRRAFRRPPTDQEVARYLQIVSSARQRGRSFDASIALAVEAVLVSPDFIFRIERDAPSPGSAPAHLISQYELASRLSYFLWSSMPDEVLMKCAAAGTLRQPEILRAQVTRMMQDPKSASFVENFAGQWLEIRRLESVKPDRERFPDFEDYLRRSMRQETELFFAYVMREDRTVLDFLTGDYTFLNERMARHYGIPGVRGPEFRKVDLTGTNRRGILTQASVLTVSSYGNRTSPVLRGKWVLETLLNAPPPPPPPDVPNLNEAAVGETASLRQQLEQHRANAVCASCHSKMDPLGFALENFDAVGAWRTVDGNFPIDASGVLPDGKTFKGVAELETILASNPNAFAECLTEKLMIYSFGRGLESYDRQTARQIAKNAAQSDYRFSSLIMGIVNSIQFEQRRRDIDPHT